MFEDASENTIDRQTSLSRTEISLRDVNGRVNGVLREVADINRVLPLYGSSPEGGKFFVADVYNPATDRKERRMLSRDMKPDPQEAREWGVSVNSDGEVSLKAIPAVKLKGETLIHVGIVEGSEESVYGDQSDNAATYLMVEGSDILTNDQANTGRRTLVVDTEKLFKLRSVFVDPETIYSEVPGDTLGKSFFILGGIPKEAITQVL